MSRLNPKVLWLVTGGLVVSAALGIAGIQFFIWSEVRATGDRAVREYPGDRVRALIQVVDCADCDLRKRNRAVWALGEIEDPAALPVLRRYHTRERCDHGADLCQYELGKAIKKIEGTWNLQSSFRYKGTHDTEP